MVPVFMRGYRIAVRYMATSHHQWFLFPSVKLSCKN